MSWLIGDIGGTHARLAVAMGPGDVQRVSVLDCADYADLESLLADFVADDLAAAADRAAIAVAGPVKENSATMTNLKWRISANRLREYFGFAEIRVLNDFAANALAVQLLEPDDVFQVGGGVPVADAPAVVVGPGTGLGVSALIPTASGPIPVSTEGGHVTIAAVDEEEAAVIAHLRRHFGHVSAERVLSGPGLENLYAALAGVRGIKAEPLEASFITAGAPADELAGDSLSMFFAMLGGFAGDLALTFGARGGVYVMGGIVPAHRDDLARSAFRQRFESKGRFRSYLTDIPTWVVLREFPALLGLSTLART